MPKARSAHRKQPFDYFGTYTAGAKNLHIQSFNTGDANRSLYRPIGGTAG